MPDWVSNRVDQEDSKDEVPRFVTTIVIQCRQTNDTSRHNKHTTTDELDV